MVTTTLTPAVRGTRAGASGAMSTSRVSIAAIAAVATNLAVYGLGRLGGLDFRVRFSDGDPWTRIGAGQVAAASLLAVVVGGLLACLLNRWSRRLGTIVRGIGAALAVISAGAPLSVTAADGAAKPALALMHLAAGAWFLYGSRRH